MNFKNWYILNEGQNEDQAIAILKYAGMKNIDKSFFDRDPQSFKDPTPTKKYLPALAVMYTIGTNSGSDYVEKHYKLGAKAKPLTVVNGELHYDGKKIDWIEFTEIIDGLISLQNPKSGINDDMPIDATPIVSKNGIDIYESNSPRACVKYGSGYSFCISQPGNTMWQSYRDSAVSTFYFVFDRKLPKSNPLHVVVVDARSNGKFALTDANNTTGTIAKYGTNITSYFSDLDQRGIDVSIFKNVPKTDEENLEAVLLGKKNNNLKWFINLSYDYKSKYIGRGHELTNEQFYYLFDNKAQDLLSQYVNIGRELEPSQLEKVATNKQLLRTYLRQRLIAIQHTEDFTIREFSLLKTFPDLMKKFNITGTNLQSWFEEEYKSVKWIDKMVDNIQNLSQDNIRVLLNHISHRDVTDEEYFNTVNKIIDSLHDNLDINHIKTIFDAASKEDKRDVYDVERPTTRYLKWSVESDPRYKNYFDASSGDRDDRHRDAYEKVINEKHKEYLKVMAKKIIHAKRDKLSFDEIDAIINPFEINGEKNKDSYEIGREMLKFLPATSKSAWYLKNYLPDDLKSKNPVKDNYRVKNYSPSFEWSSYDK